MIEKVKTFARTVFGFAMYVALKLFVVARFDGGKEQPRSAQERRREEFLIANGEGEKSRGGGCKRRKVANWKKELWGG